MKSRVSVWKKYVNDWLASDRADETGWRGNVFAFIEKVRRKNFESHMMKILLFSAWICSHILFPWHRGSSLPEVGNQIITYEIFWYAGVLLIVVTPYILRYMVKGYVEEMGRSSREKKHGLYWFAIFVTVAILLTLPAGIADQSEHMFFVYGPVYAVVLYIITIFFFLPSFLNIFYVFFSFWDEMKRKFDEEEELLSRTISDRIYCFKSINIYFLVAYALFLIMVILAFMSDSSSSELAEGGAGGSFLGEIVESFVLFAQGKMDFSYDLVMGFAYLFVPLFLPTLYYFLATRSLKKLIMDFILLTGLESEKDLKKVDFVFFDRKSSFHLGGLINYNVVPLLVTLIPVVVEVYKTLQD